MGTFENAFNRCLLRRAKETGKGTGEERTATMTAERGKPITKRDELWNRAVDKKEGVKP